jgi:hypothetical protein
MLLLVVKMKSAPRIFIFGLAAMFALSSCGSDDVASGGSDTPGAVDSPAIWSLTGLPGPDDAQLKPILLVKIENNSIVRPQTGLDRADLIFEELVEGGATRFAAAYQSNIPDEVGPVRSVRHVDVSLAAPIADVFAFSGGAKKTMKYVGLELPTAMSQVREGAPGMNRKPGVLAPNNLFLDTKQMFAAVAEYDTPSSGFFVPSPMSAAVPAPSSSTTSTPVVPAPVGKTVNTVEVAFSTLAKPNWKWNATDKLWMRSEGSNPFNNIDGSQFGTNNLVIIEIREVDAGYKGSTGGYVPRSVTSGSGRGWVLSNGKAVEVRWNKPSVVSQMELSDTNGNPFIMPTGRTWVELLPVETTGKYGFDGVAVPMGTPPQPAAVPERGEIITP